MENENVQEVISYPKPTTDGFCYLNEEDEIVGIESKTYDNDKEVKRVILSKDRKAVVRELKAWEMEDTSKVLKNEKIGDGTLMAIAAAATTIDEKNIVYEDVKFMKAKDWSKLRTAVARLNF